MNIAIAICQKDIPLITLWAKWLVAVGVSEGTEIYLTVDQKVDDNTLSRVHHILHREGGIHVHLDIYFGKDPGYPGAANRMFIFTAERAAKSGKPFLWMETDMIPTRPGWMDEVVKEYEECGKPFMGPVLHVYDIPHMNGTAVYPADWAEQSDIAKAPDHWPWDTYSRHSVEGKTHSSQTLKHFYGNRTFPKDKEHLGECAAFHPVKDGSLIRYLNESQGLLKDEAFEAEALHLLWHGNQSGMHRVSPRKVNMNGVNWHTLRADTIEKQVLAFRSGTPHVISEEEYHKLIAL